MIKKYELNDGVFVIHHTLVSLCQNYYECIPKNVQKQLVNLIENTRDILYIEHSSTINYDIVYDKIIRKVKFSKNKKF